MRWLHREGFLIPGRSSNVKWSRNGERVADINIRVEDGRVILFYSVSSNGGEREAMEYPVPLDWTSCHFSARRPWFLCPCCGRRVAVLFGGKVFACRHCHNLAYDCQREAAHSRLQSRALKIRDRLGWKSDWGDKPKGMHWKTFARLVAEYDRFDTALWKVVAERFKLFPDNPDV